MNAKLFALGLAVAAFVVLEAWMPRDHGVSQTESSEQLPLVPATLAGKKPFRSWENRLPHGVIEQGALFGSAGDPVQLDYFRHYTQPHRGIVCYVTRGETLLSENLRTARTAQGPATFDVAFLYASGQLRLVATTQCTATGCAEELVRAPSTWQQLSTWLRFTSATTRRANVVPVSVVLTHPALPEEQSAAEQRLLAEFDEAASGLDLSPAQSLAALQ